MARKKKGPNRVDDLLDDLLEDCVTPKDILGKSGLMGQIKKRLVERALAGELSAHLNNESADESTPGNSRNGSSKKTVTSTSYRYRETARVALNQYWCRSISAASSALMRRYWRSTPEGIVRVISALN